MFINVTLQIIRREKMKYSKANGRLYSPKLTCLILFRHELGPYTELSRNV
jgi:hypothetical protein